MIDNTKEILKALVAKGKIENIDYRIVYFDNKKEIKIIG